MPNRDELAARHFEILKVGLLACQVCSDMPLEDVERRLNREMPAGTTNGWIFDEERRSCGDDPNPQDCADGKGKHYVFVC